MDAIEKLQAEKKKLGAKFEELHKAQMKYFAKQDMDGVAEFRRRKEEVIELARGLNYAIEVLKNSQ